MREIKFRAWDKVASEMYYIDKGTFRLISMGFGLCGGVEPIVQIDYFETEKGNSPDIATLEDYEMMQFTGLLDKNGKEIYEGDIVFREDKGMYEVTWDQRSCSFVLGNGNENWKWLKGCYCDVYDVIGNIYDHPNLLSGCKPC